MSAIPDLPGVLSAAEVVQSAESIAALQLPTGMIPWFVGGHCDPWNHVETAMALDVAGMHTESERAYEWLVDIQRADGSWWNYYLPDGTVEEAKLDTNVCAYVATGVWHHWRCTWDRGFVDHLWPTVERAVEWVLGMRKPNGTVLWARTEHAVPWDYALLTGSSSIAHALRCAANLANLINEPRPEWEAAARHLADMVAHHPRAFEPKHRWAMDWYYPVLTGALSGEAAKAHLADKWDVFAMEGKGIRCVSDEPWITASETAEAAIAHAAIGDVSTATDLLAWTHSHRLDDGSYWTGIVYPSGERFPAGETSAYTAAAVILAADSITGASPSSDLFVPKRTD
ncbi:MAG: prenyltransferase [Actinobacteria bacterium]|nr:prenyltransferase [Actinomycetota bacterium]